MASRRARPARGRARPTRNRPALHRRAHHGRHRHHGSPRRQGTGPQAGVSASFMPKPLAGVRLGMHTHLRCGVTIRMPSSATGLRPQRSATKFIAGLVFHAPEITAITNQWSIPTSAWCPATKRPWARLARHDARRWYGCFGQASRIDSTRVGIPLARCGRQSLPRVRRHSRRRTSRVIGDYELPSEGKARRHCLNHSPALDLMRTRNCCTRRSGRTSRVVPA